MTVVFVMIAGIAGASVRSGNPDSTYLGFVVPGDIAANGTVVAVVGADPATLDPYLDGRFIPVTIAVIDVNNGSMVGVVIQTVGYDEAADDPSQNGESLIAGGGGFRGGHQDGGGEK